MEFRTPLSGSWRVAGGVARRCGYGGLMEEGFDGFRMGDEGWQCPVAAVPKFRHRFSGGGGSDYPRRPAGSGYRRTSLRALIDMQRRAQLVPYDETHSGAREVRLLDLSLLPQRGVVTDAEAPTFAH